MAAGAGAGRRQPRGRGRGSRWPRSSPRSSPPERRWVRLQGAAAEPRAPRAAGRCRGKRAGAASVRRSLVAGSQLVELDGKIEKTLDTRTAAAVAENMELGGFQDDSAVDAG